MKVNGRKADGVPETKKRRTDLSSVSCIARDSDTRGERTAISTNRCIMLHAIYCIAFLSSAILLLPPLHCQAAPPIAAVASLRHPRSFPAHHYNRRRRCYNTARGYSQHSLYLPSSKSIVATAKTKRKDRSSSATSHNATPIAESPNQLQEQPTAEQQQQHPIISYDDLGLLGKLVAGTVELTLTTLIEFASGFVGGYFLGTLTDVPRLLFRPMESPPTRPTFFREFSGRLNRMHGKSFRWATSWGGISAAFGGFRVLAKLVRGGKEDEWSNILSSMAAGAYFARAGALSWRVLWCARFALFCYLVVVVVVSA